MAIFQHAIFVLLHMQRCYRCYTFHEPPSEGSSSPRYIDSLLATLPVSQADKGGFPCSSRAFSSSRFAIFEAQGGMTMVETHTIDVRAFYAQYLTLAGKPSR